MCAAVFLLACECPTVTVDSRYTSHTRSTTYQLCCEAWGHPLQTPSTSEPLELAASSHTLGNRLVPAHHIHAPTVWDKNTWPASCWEILLVHALNEDKNLESHSQLLVTHAEQHDKEVQKYDKCGMSFLKLMEGMCVCVVKKVDLVVFF